MDERRHKSRGFLKLLLILVLVCAAVLAVVLAVYSREDGGLRALWRRISGMETADEFFFENASGGSAADMDLSLAVAAQSGLYVYDEAGEISFSRLYSWQDPYLCVEGSYGAVCDVGGQTVIFFTPVKILAEVECESPVISATVNSLGYLAVTTEADGYAARVTVYNSAGTAIYRWSSGQNRIISARVSGRDKLLVTTVGEGGSRIVYLTMDEESERVEYKYPGLIFDTRITDTGIMAVSTTGLVGLDGSLREVWTVDFGGRYLTGYAVTSSSAAVALSDFQVGGGRHVVTVSSSGQTLGEAEISGEIFSVDTRGGRVAVLTDGKVTVYGNDMTEETSYDCGFGAEQTMLRSDGSVLCAGTFSAYVYGE